MSRNGHGAHEAPRQNGRRNVVIVVVIVLLLLLLGAGYLLANDGDEDPASPSVSPTRSSEPSPTEDPTPSETAPPTVTISPEPVVLEDGRHFVFTNGAKTGANASLTFDLAEFYQGQDAIDAATAHGDEATNDYYIVNDNPKLRTLPVAPDVVVRYIPAMSCCELKPGNFDAFAEAVNDTNQTDYFIQAPWWITVDGGQIVEIEQQYLP